MQKSHPRDDGRTAWLRPRFAQPKRRHAGWAGWAATVLIGALALAGCAGADNDLAYTRDSRAPQSFPANYKSDLLGLLRTYLTDPTGVRDAAVSEPALRDIRGRSLYVSCLRYNARNAVGQYRGVTQRLAVFVDGRLDSIAETGSESCTNAAYMPFPDMEKLTR